MTLPEDQTHAQPFLLGQQQHQQQSRKPRRRQTGAAATANGWKVSPLLLWVSVLVTLSATSTILSQNYLLVVQALPEHTGVSSSVEDEKLNPNGSSSSSSSKKKGPPPSTLDNIEAELSFLMGDFRKNLRRFTYIDLLVQATTSNKASKSRSSTTTGTSSSSTQPHKGQPPVMIGRRRNLLEHNVHHYYSVTYLHSLHRHKLDQLIEEAAALKAAEQEEEQEQIDDNKGDEVEGEGTKQEKDDGKDGSSSTSSLSFDRDRIDAAIASIEEALKAYLYQTSNDASRKADPQRQQHNAATSNSLGLPPFPPGSRRTNAQLIRDMFYHSYNSYMKHAFPAAELLPLNCQPGTFDLVRLPALTLIDTLDTLLVLADGLEFAKSVERLRQFHEKHLENGGGGIFAVNQNVSVFETTIRVLGGLLSAHQMAVAFLNVSLELRNADDTIGEQHESTLKLPPVFLEDVFSLGSSDDEEEYLQTPETVRRILLHHRKASSAAAEAAAQGEGDDANDGTCSLGGTTTADDATAAAAVEGDVPPAHPTHGSGSASSDHDWKEHCGAGVLSLEDCAASNSNKHHLQQRHQQQQMFVNQTSLQREQLRLKLKEPQWEYDGFLLELAIEIADRLMPAFETRTGIPYGTVNLLSGVPSGETTIASLAGGGTLSLEFELLSRLTGDLRYGQAAKLATRALWTRRSSLHLVGKHIDIQRGTWTESLSGIGSNSDSFLEYLLKHYLLFPEEEDFWPMLQAAYTGIFKDARLGEWYADVDMKTGKQAWPKGMIKRVFESLMAFYPGMQTLMGELVPAGRSLNSFFMVREFLGFLPERFSYSSWKVDGGISSGAAKYLLRPELLESCYFMHRATKRDNHDSRSSSSGWQWAADFALHHLEKLTRARCGYASVRGLNPATGNLGAYQRPEIVKLSNEMPSFFLSETLKYLYLTFDDENIIHKDRDRDWIFTTEAHPIHFVPTFQRTQDSVKINHGKGDPPQLKSTKERLRKKLKELKFHNKHGTYRGSKKKIDNDGGVSSHYLAEELWSDSTPPRKHRNSIKEVVDEIWIERFEEEARNEEEEALPWHPIMSFFGENTPLLDSMLTKKQEQVTHMYHEVHNLAHVAWNSLGMGNGYWMRKACPNIFAPELVWVNALSGGGVDYTDIYVSAFSETESDYPSTESLALLVTSAEALSVHGSGVFLGNMDPAVSTKDRCEIAKLIANQRKMESTAQSSSDSPPQQQSSEAAEEATSHVQQVELAGVGTFEISAFPEGSGFFLRHIDSGESIMATFIVGGEAAEDVTLMVYASMPRAKIAASPESTQTDESVAENGEEAEETSNDVEESEKEGKQSPWKLVGPKLASLFKKRRSSSDDENMVVEMGSPERKVVIADLNSNSFHCEVNMVRRYLSRELEMTLNDNETTVHEETPEDVVVASYPCAPALFGPTHISKLLATGGAFVEQIIMAPTDEDEFGCGLDEDDEIPTVTPVNDEAPQEGGSNEDPSIQSEQTETMESSCENKTIQVVQRGHCSFYSKASNQQHNSNAEGVIVINTEEDELFIMSHGEEENTDMDEDQLPVTVLVTGLDGEDIVETIEAQTVIANGEEEDRSYLVAQISVLKQQHTLDGEGTFRIHGDSIEWPIVRGAEEALQIFAEGGWGIHAMRKDGGSIRDVSGSNDLQLFLLRHSD